MSDKMDFAPVVEADKPYVNFGEVVLFDHFDGVWVAGNRQPEKFDTTNPIHAAMESWKINHYFHIQFYPHQSKFESFPNFWKQRGSKKYPI